VKAHGAVEANIHAFLTPYWMEMLHATAHLLLKACFRYSLGTKYDLEDEEKKESSLCRDIEPWSCNITDCGIQTQPVHLFQLLPPKLRTGDVDDRVVIFESYAHLIFCLLFCMGVELGRSY
jgi:hypothetical protein